MRREFVVGLMQRHRLGKIGPADQASGPSWIYVVVISALGLLLSACSSTIHVAHVNLPAMDGSAKSTAVAGVPDMIKAHPPKSPERLAKLSRKELLARLGRPNFTRHDPPAEIWQYRSADCVLDVFLYPEADDLHVAHAVTRDPTSMKTNAVVCSPFTTGERTAAAG